MEEFSTSVVVTLEQIEYCRLNDLQLKGVTFLYLECQLAIIDPPPWKNLYTKNHLNSHQK